MAIEAAIPARRRARRRRDALRRFLSSSRESIDLRTSDCRCPCRLHPRADSGRPSGLTTSTPMNVAGTSAQAGPGEASPLERLVSRFDPSVFDVGPRRVRLRLEGAAQTRDVLIEHGRAWLTESTAGGADAVLSADPETWKAIADDVRDGMTAFRRGRLRVRRDLHLGVGFLAATAPPTGPGRLKLRPVQTAEGEISTVEAGSGEPVILLHGLGATKASFLPTIAALAPSYRPIAIDLPG